MWTSNWTAPKHENPSRTRTVVWDSGSLPVRQIRRLANINFTFKPVCVKSFWHAHRYRYLRVFNYISQRKIPYNNFELHLWAVIKDKKLSWCWQTRATRLESVNVTKHSTVPYVRYSFLLVWNSNFVFKRHSTSKIPWLWKPGYGSVKVIGNVTIR